MDIMTPLFVQLLIDCILGFVAAMVWGQTWLRIVSALAVPFAVAFFQLGPSFFLPLSGHTRDFWCFCASFVGFGFPAAAVGTVIGALMRRELHIGRCA